MDPRGPVPGRLRDAALGARPATGGARLPREIVHSPLGRTSETARAVASAIADLGPAAPLPVLRADPGLREIGQGEWEGVTSAEITRRWPDQLAGWRRDPLSAHAPGGESLQEVDARVRPALAHILDELGRDYPRGTTNRAQVPGHGSVRQAGTQPWSILVGHDGVFKVVMLALFDLPLAKFWSFSLALTGISVVEVVGGRPVLRAHNLVSHLAPIEDEVAREAAEVRARSGAL
jgi:broad specificity phosphatase PhoE